MTRPYRLSTRNPIAPSHPLHWQRFWPDLQRVHRGKAEARQDLVLWLANLYHGTIRCGKPVGFCTVQVQLTKLSEWVRDYRPALDYFFEVKQLGYRLDEDNRELSTLVPRRLAPSDLKVVDQTQEELRYEVPALPKDSVISKVYLQPGLDRQSLIERTLQAGRPELVPQLTWLLKQHPELNFHFAPSGKLQKRDTSVWPISGIETWPSWLRKELFGPGIDIDSAYVSFLLEYLSEEFKGKEQQMQLLFPDLIRLLHDKEAFRKELCEQVLQRPYTTVWRGVIKSVLMSIANGSRVSGSLLTNGTEFSQTAKIIQEAAPEATITELMNIGDRLQYIARQFDSARKRLCNSKLNMNPTRKNLKKVFAEYFAWEREARYAIWKEIGQHGIMVHDGIDGVPQEYLDKLPEISQKLGLRLTA
jgi:hypothetical protein